eukprot:m.313456 g.313456  ORF g.313456 m.313456 type:complete len:133 (-) comp55408_c0_seq42:228-626(-)
MCWLKAPIPRRKVIGARFIWVHQANAPGLKSFALCSCVVWLEEDRTEDQLQVINETKNVQLSQRTPIRVLHRRSLADRERCVFKFDISISSPVSLGSRVRLNSFFLLCAACRTSESSPISSSCAFQRKLEPT